MKSKISQHSRIFSCIVLLLLMSNVKTHAQEVSQMVRIAKLEIDSTQLASYNKALKEEIESSVKLEEGVLTLYAVSDKKRPNRITILEIYADKKAYEQHLQTRHFLKYKQETKAMVKSLELIESVPLIPNLKIK